MYHARQKHFLSAVALLGGLSLSSCLKVAAAEPPAPPGINCSSPPAINPSKDFVANFYNQCYAIPLGAGHGGSSGGDLGSEYDQIFYKVMPGYEFVVFDQFPNARFMSVMIYDQHAANTSEMLDYNIQPLNSKMSNPFQTGIPYQPKQYFGVSVSLGGGVPTNPAAGCSTADTTIDQNLVDASQIHSGLTWLGYSGLPPHFPMHQTGANSAGAILVRKYGIDSNTGPAVLFIRQLSDGCAITASAANQLGIVTPVKSVGGLWEDAQQIHAHQDFASNIQPRYCFPPDPNNHLVWSRYQDYVPEINSDSAYLFGPLGANLVPKLVSSGAFMRIQFPLATFPNTPCTTGTCFLTGNEQLRYFSMSFEDHQQNVYATLRDSQFVQDPSGNVTLIVGFGKQPPPQVTAANYYTYLDLSQFPNYQNINQINIRNILPNVTFQCSAWNVPYLYTEYNPEGGYMGQYVPTVDVVGYHEIPTLPTPPVRPNSCAIVPTETPVVCRN